MSNVQGTVNQHYRCAKAGPGASYLECIGFVGRALLTDELQLHGWQLDIYILETLLLLLAPAFFAGSIYMTLTRIVRLTNGQKHSLLPAEWLTKIFVAGDAIAFVLQAVGGGLNAAARTLEEESRGRDLIIAGLIVQLITFCLFIILAVIFYVRMNQAPTTTSGTLNTTWKRHLILLVVSCFLILFRSIFRLAEYILGSDGPLMEREIFTILLDSVLMFLCMLLFNLFHPSQALNENLAHLTEVPVIETKEEGFYSPRSTQDGNV
ncbi:hypothetical protein PSTG_09192 [Puccinia striiformis f. sp. tritici PST-78]|uniref:RTA1 like protein n=2 Tax=Puccinia striiformis f. sp. tritici TaxID=168172 RepID=A0A0L0VEV8_9BASI|nr:hypothetical protein PSTG_09192 [Puccinia striiformis f. sp. tritici PST-78]